MSQLVGEKAETIALQYLQQQGMKFVTRNFRCSRGEIDLILKDKEELVFVEVRYRQKKEYGSGVETVDAIKQKKLYRSAEYYLHRHKLSDCPCRFDVIGVGWDSQQQLEISWEKNAFDGNYLI